MIHHFRLQSSRERKEERGVLFQDVEWVTVAMTPEDSTARAGSETGFFFAPCPRALQRRALAGRFSRMSLPRLLPTLALLALTASAQQTPHSFQGEARIPVGYRYLLALPEGYEADTARQWPLVVFLHGAGERGTDLELLKKHGPPKLVEAGQKLPAIVASLQCEKARIWDPHGVKAVTDHLAATLRVDTRRIYLTGLSMGGFGTWETALEHPETYAAIAPICGGAGVRWVMAERIKDLPCWIFHGDQDKAVPLEFSTKIHDALIKAGSQAKLTIYPGVGHDSWTRTYENQEFWDWLLAQKRE